MTTITLAPGVVLPDKLKALLGELHGWTYGLGAKISPLSKQQPGLTNTSGDTEIDCSGFALWALYHLTGGTFSENPLSVNSATLHSIIGDGGYVACDPAAGHALDGRLRIYFLDQDQTEEGIGHVLLTCDNETYESHGSTGPASREWGSMFFMGEMWGFVLN